MYKPTALLMAAIMMILIGLPACSAAAATATPTPADITIRVTGYLIQVDQDKSFPPERQAEIEAHALQFPNGSDPNYQQWSAALDKKYPVIYEQVPGLYFLGYITITANGKSTTSEVTGATPRDYLFKEAGNDSISCTFHNTDFPDGNLPEYLQVDILKNGNVIATGNTKDTWTGLTVSTSGQ